MRSCEKSVLWGYMGGIGRERMWVDLIELHFVCVCIKFSDYKLKEGKYLRQQKCYINIFYINSLKIKTREMSVDIM